MANLNLPSNVKQDPNTGLYLITNAQGKTVRVNADTQDQLNQYVNSVNTGTPASITVTDALTGNPRTRTFDPGAIVAQQDSQANQAQLLTAGKRQAGVLGNSDGSYQDLKTGQTITQEQAAAKIQAAGLPPETLAAVTPKNSSAYAAAQQSINQTTNVPSNIPPADASQPVQSPGGNSTSPATTQSAVPNTTAAAIPSGVFAPTPNPVDTPLVADPNVTVPESAPEPVPQGNSPYASQRTQQNQQIESATPAAVDTGAVPAAANASSSYTRAPAPVDTPLLTPAESIARAQVAAPAPVDAAAFNANTNASVLGAIGVPPPVDPAQDQSAAESARLGRGEATAAANVATAENNALAAAGAAYKQKAQEEGAVQAQFQSPANGDWRVRLHLAPGAKYLYNAEGPGILAPLAASNGVVFPYMPTIQTTYTANYESVELTHSNYRGQFYKSSYVGDVQITGIFTAQDTAEANYLLAVIHFFRSVTKMFYGAKDPLRGAPPPLVYLIGLGQYQFNNQPCVVKTFNYSMPNDCDYIKTKPNNYNTNLGGRSAKPQAASDPISTVISRLRNAALPQGAVPNVPAQSLLEMQSVTNIVDATYVPTKCEIQITLMPIQTRSQQSQQFNMQNFANGNLLKGGFW
jgi:hypothetical protein